MHYVCVPGLGYVHKLWKSEEPRFCSDLSKAKSWKKSDAAIDFCNKELVTRVHVRWELWQETNGALLPIIRPRSASL